MAEVQYASNGKANAALTTGIIGTSLGAIASMGGLAGLLGIAPQTSDPNEKPVTRYEMSLIRDTIAKDSEIAALKGQLYTDNKVAGLQAEISAQAVWNATQEGVVRMQAAQLAQLYSMTKLVIPNGNVAPGWGPAYVVPGVPPVTTVQATPATTGAARKHVTATGLPTRGGLGGSNARNEISNRPRDNRVPAERYPAPDGGRTVHADNRIHRRKRNCRKQ